MSGQPVSGIVQCGKGGNPSKFSGATIYEDEDRREIIIGLESEGTHGFPVIVTLDVPNAQRLLTEISVALGSMADSTEVLLKKLSAIVGHASSEKKGTAERLTNSP